MFEVATYVKLGPHILCFPCVNLRNIRDFASGGAFSGIRPLAGPLRPGRAVLARFTHLTLVDRTADAAKVVGIAASSDY